MKTGIGSDTAKSAKALAQQIAKQVAREPLEVLKTAGSQVAGTEVVRPPEIQTQPQNSEDQGKMLHHQQELQDKMKSGRRMEALNRELDDIRKQKVFKDLQEKISRGEEIFLEEYPELSLEQKQVLKAQMEAVKAQEARIRNQGSGLIEPSTKPSRRFGPTRKQEAEKQQQRVEKPVPPSG